MIQDILFRILHAKLHSLIVHIEKISWTFVYHNSIWLDYLCWMPNPFFEYIKYSIHTQCFDPYLFDWPHKCYVVSIIFTLLFWIFFINFFFIKYYFHLGKNLPIYIEIQLWSIYLYFNISKSIIAWSLWTTNCLHRSIQDSSRSWRRAFFKKTIGNWWTCCNFQWYKTKRNHRYLIPF